MGAPYLPVLADMGTKNPSYLLLYQGTTQWVPHICPVLEDMGTKNLSYALLYQGTTSVVPHSVQIESGL